MNSRGRWSLVLIRLFDNAVKTQLSPPIPPSSAFSFFLQDCHLIVIRWLLYFKVTYPYSKQETRETKEFVFRVSVILIQERNLSQVPLCITGQRWVTCTTLDQSLLEQEGLTKLAKTNHYSSSTNGTGLLCLRPSNRAD